MTLNVYLAADYARRDEIFQLTQQDDFTSLDIQTTSRWLTEPPAFNDGGIGGPGADVRVARAVVENDLQDVANADVLVQFTTGEKVRGGRHVEFGYALAIEIGMVIVGPREHVFHYHPNVIVCLDWPEALQVLTEYI